MELRQLLVLPSLTLLLLGCSQFDAVIGGPKTIDGWELLGDIPEAVQAAETPNDIGPLLCRNEETGDEVRGVFDSTGEYFPLVRPFPEESRPKWCVVPPSPGGRSAKVWQNNDQNFSNLEDMKVDFRLYVFHPDRKQAMPVRQGPITLRGGTWYLVGYTR